MNSILLGLICAVLNYGTGFLIAWAVAKAYHKVKSDVVREFLDMLIGISVATGLLGTAITVLVMALIVPATVLICKVWRFLDQVKQGPLK